MEEKRDKKEKREDKDRRGTAAGNPNVIQIMPGVNGGPPTVDQPQKPVSKGQQDHIQWACSASNDWMVAFEGDSPFDAHYFHPGKPGNTTVIGDYRAYKYSIYVDGTSADPVIIVTR